MARFCFDYEILIDDSEMMCFYIWTKNSEEFFPLISFFMGTEDINNNYLILALPIQEKWKKKSVIWSKALFQNYS